MGYKVVVDLGGTKMLAALVNERDEIVIKHRYSSEAGAGPHKITGNLAAIVEQLHKEADVSREEFDGLGLCVAGFYDYKAGEMYISPNLPGWEGFPLKKELSGLLDRPVVIENDANAAAYGEYLLGAGKGMENIVQVTLGTGIGGGIIIGGKIYRGASFAGEIGHLIVLPSGPLCGCGNRGCLETLSSGTAIAREGRLLLKSDTRTMLKQMVENIDDLGATHVFDAARKGDPAANGIVKKAAYFLGLGLAGVVNILNPDAIIFSGGLSQVGELFWAPVRESLERAAIKPAAKKVSLLVTELGEEAGIKGILALLNEFLQLKQ
jgi:glucokinase